MSTLKNYADSWTEEDVKTEIAETAQEKSDESEFLSIKPDTELVLRFMPNPAGGSPFVRFAKHFYKDPNTNKWVSFPCPAKSKLNGFQNYDCPICEMSAKLRKSRIQTDRDLGYKMRASYRALVNVLVRPADDDVQAAINDGLEPPRGKVKVWEISSWTGEKNGKNMHERMLALRTNRRVGGNFIDPSSNGFDVLLTREGSGIDTRYEVHGLLNEKRPLLADPAAAQELIEEKQLDLTWYVTPPTQEQLMNILQGGDNRRGGNDRAVPAGAARPSLPAGGGASAADAIDVASDDDYGTPGATGSGF